MLCMRRSDKNLQQAAQVLEEAVSSAVGCAFNSTTGQWHCCLRDLHYTPNTFHGQSFCHML